LTRDAPPENGRTASYQPPPPPNFFEEEMAEYRPAPKAAAPSTTNGNNVHADNGRPPANQQQAKVIVMIRPHAGWRETCRRAVELAERHRGQSGLALVVAAQKLRMELPNHRVDPSPELLEALGELDGVTAVEMK
jgi:hypothetical protein